MTGGDEDNSPDDAHDDDELASKLARLTEEQRTRYQTEVQNNIDRNAEASRNYRLRLASTLLKNFPAREESLEISELNRRQDQAAYQRDHPRAEPNRPGTILPPIQEPPRLDRDSAPSPALSQPQPANSLDNKTPNAPPRDYSELQRTHEQVAGHLKQSGRQAVSAEAPGQSVEPATAMLSKERLVIMLEHFPEMRREANLPTTQSEINERAALAHMQDIDRTKLEQTHGPQPDRQQQDERNLLDHQHLAEQAGVQGKWIALHLKAQNSPDAAQYGRDSRSAFQTARLTHEQRQNLRAGSGRDQDPAHGAEEGHHQQQANAQDAARTGVLTSEQRANPSAETRQTMERQERGAAREAGVGGKDQKAQQGNANTGKSPSGGRSR